MFIILELLNLDPLSAYIENYFHLAYLIENSYYLLFVLDICIQYIVLQS